MDFHHDITIELEVGPEGGEDTVEIECRLLCRFSPGRPATPPAYDHGGLPPEDAEAELMGVEIWDASADKYRAPLAPYDDGIVTRAEDWFDDHYDDVVDAGGEAAQDDEWARGDYEYDRWKDERFDRSANLYRSA